jgi:hypothetical protein
MSSACCSGEEGGGGGNGGGGFVVAFGSIVESVGVNVGDGFITDVDDALRPDSTIESLRSSFCEVVISGVFGLFVADVCATRSAGLAMAGLLPPLASGLLLSAVGLRLIS